MSREQSLGRRRDEVPRRRPDDTGNARHLASAAARVSWQPSLYLCALISLTSRFAPDRFMMALRLPSCRRPPPHCATTTSPSILTVPALEEASSGSTVPRLR